MFPSWPDMAFFRMFSGEPAMSIIPNRLTTGVLAFIMGLAAARIRALKRWWADKAPAGLQRFFAFAWGWIFALCALSWLALFPGLNLLGYSYGVENEALTITIILLALATLVLTVIYT